MAGGFIACPQVFDGHRRRRKYHHDVWLTGSGKRTNDNSTLRSRRSLQQQHRCRCTRREHYDHRSRYTTGHEPRLGKAHLSASPRVWRTECSSQFVGMLPDPRIARSPARYRISKLCLVLILLTRGIAGNKVNECATGTNRQQDHPKSCDSSHCSAACEGTKLRRRPLANTDATYPKECLVV